MRVKDIKERVLEAVKRSEETPIYKVAKGADVSVATASKYCYILAAENKVKITSFGNMKLVSRK